jgi:hypothetical protein
MGRALHKPMELAVKSVSKKPRVNQRTRKAILAYGDGGLSVSPPNASSWIFRDSAPSPFVGKDARPRS